jgi:hypothetical protein
MGTGMSTFTMTPSPSSCGRASASEVTAKAFSGAAVSTGASPVPQAVDRQTASDTSKLFRALQLAREYMISPSLPVHLRRMLDGESIDNTGRSAADRNESVGRPEETE